MGRTGVWSPGYPPGGPVKCNICGKNAEYIVQLELVRRRNSYYGNILHSHEMPFYLCTRHEYLYKKMHGNIDLKDYFTETIIENQ
ncbi:MAG: hypothetical protein ABI361_10875 [Nitrososphaera sp.]